MLNALSKIIPLGAHFRRQHVANTTQRPRSFPIDTHDIDLLKAQIKNCTKLRLSRDDFLALVKSTIVETRRDALQLNSITDINSILDETDMVSNLVFAQIGEHTPRFRYALRLEYFRQVIGLGDQFRVEAFKLLQDHTGFPAHKQLQQDLARRQMEANLELEYNLPPCRNTQRIARHNISSIGKAEYARHCLNLYNLGMPISADVTEKMVKLCQDMHLPRQWINLFQSAHHNQVPVHVVISDLLRADLNRHGNHNTHPASRLMEFSTGFVFHPNSAANVYQLLSPQSPSAFQNIGKLLTDKYLAALACNNAKHFFENAFVQQDPCFEATVENLVEFKPEQPVKMLTAPPTPRWTPLATIEENIEALLDWQEMANLKSYVDSNNIPVKVDEHKKIDQLLGCTEFHMYLHNKKAELLSQISSRIPNSTVHQLQAQFDARWP